MTPVPVFCEACRRRNKPQRLIAHPYIRRPASFDRQAIRGVYLACEWCDLTKLWPDPAPSHVSTQSPLE